jgi:hypothetical protein
VHIRREQARRNATPNLRPPLLVKLDCLPFQLSRLLTAPRLSFTLLSNKHPGISTGNRRAADVIIHNRDTAAGEVDIPPERRRGQIQLEHRQRDEVATVVATLLSRLDICRKWRVGSDGTTEHSGSPINQVGWRGEQDGVNARAERRFTTGPTFDPVLSPHAYAQPGDVDSRSPRFIHYAAFRGMAASLGSRDGLRRNFHQYGRVRHSGHAATRTTCQPGGSQTKQ